jgi:hypothetical protein
MPSTRIFCVRNAAGGVNIEVFLYRQRSECRGLDDEVAPEHSERIAQGHLHKTRAVALAGDVAQARLQPPARDAGIAAHNVEQVLGFFRQWVSSANKKYRQNLANEAARKQRIARQQLERERKAAEERVQVLEKLRKIART